RCVMEVTRAFCKVRNPRFVALEQDDAGKLVGAWQTLGGARRAVPVGRVRVFTLHGLVSDDVRGVSAVHPILQTVDDMLEARKVNRAVAKRLGTPVRIVELPPTAHEDDQGTMADLLDKVPADADLVLPPGAKLSVLGQGRDVLQPDEATREHLTDRILMGLGVTKIALGLPDGSNRSVSEVQRAMLLADKVAPYQRQVKAFAERLYGELFGRRPVVTFEPVDVQDELVVAQVSKALVETGVKTKDEVSQHYWRWTD
ncbi:MAG: hypothetical protein LC624_10835, partial [Halobacteriales archaeon]|nr:hypothetical protein [Halobacteriales archaeon]